VNVEHSCDRPDLSMVWLSGATPDESTAPIAARSGMPPAIARPA
jgi:hypothetical protein